MTQIALIADDLTGANDSGVQFVRHGFSASVFFAGQPVQQGADVVVLDTDTRGATAAEAYEATRKAAGLLVEIKPSLVYKKVDSTLRGNLAAEIDAVMDAFGMEVALIAPAFPRIGRTTEDGVQYLNGAPVHETEIGRDPKAPVRTSNIPQLLRDGSRRKVGLIHHETVRDGLAPERLRDLRADGAELIVCDGLSEQDLVQVARAGRELGGRVLYVGSAGLADVLPKELGLMPGARAAAREEAAGPTGPVLLAVGSVSSVSRGQLARVLREPAVTGVELRTADWISGGPVAEAEEERCFAAGVAALQAGGDLALFSSVQADAVARTQALGRARGMSPIQVSEQVAEALGRIAGRLCQSARVGGLVLTGGDTAQAVCRNVGATGFDLLSEVEPGIPLGRLVGAAPYRAVTKAGAFGTEEALWSAMQRVKGGVPA